MISSPQLTQTIRQFIDIAMHHSLRERAHFAKGLGLSMPQLGILMQLHYREYCGISDISERFRITNAAASQLVDKLVQSGLIHREEDPQDRRAKLLNLTDKAKELMQQSLKERYRWIDELAGKLTAEERAKVTEAMIILTQAARELEAESVQQTA
jgi:DNA-binding MarR family transcriptional regulator